MQKPDLNQMWETFVKIPTENNGVRLNVLYNNIRSKIYPMISHLKSNDMINWYCFLIHDRNSGVPTSEDDRKPYFHIRFALKKDVDPNDFLSSLPNYCVMTRRIERRLESIAGINKSIIKNEKIEEVWRIIGEQSEWLLEMLNIHKEDVDIPLQQIAQFLHYYANMTQLPVR
jgi:hypothetical protein